MKRKLFFIIAIISMAFTTPIYADGDSIPLQVTDINPTNDDDGPHKGPIQVPEVSLDDHTLYFFTPCDGCVLNIVDGSGAWVYTLVIPAGTTSLELPATLTGDYELQIIRGNYCFWGEIVL